jgi:hypothetical protein
MFENRVLRRIFAPKREEGTEGWRRLHNDQLHNLCASPAIVRVIILLRMIWARHIAQMGERRNAYSILVGKSEEKRLLGRPRYTQIILELILG